MVGNVSINNQTSKGTTLRILIPLTLAIIPALIVRSLNQSFALRQGALSELVHVPPEMAASAIEWIDNAPLYRLRGRLLPLVFLDRLLMPGSESRLHESKPDESQHGESRLNESRLNESRLRANRDNFIAVL